MASEQLKKEIRFSQLFAIGFGTIIGVGWMIVAGSWIETAGPFGALLAFVVGAAAISVVGLCYGEMAALFPQSGGEVVYAFEGFGSGIAFMTGWFLLLVYIAICAFEAISVAWILSILFPGLEGPVLYELFGAKVTLGSLALGLGGMALLSFANYRGGYASATLQNWVTWLFVAVSGLFVVVGVGAGDIDNARPFFSGANEGPAWLGFLSVLATIPVWYSGFNTLPQALGEIENLDQSKYFARTLLAVIFAGLLFYSGVILATSFAASREVLGAAELPVAAALFTIFDSRWAGNLVLFAGLLGIVTSWNAIFFSGARVLFCLGRARLISHRFAQVSPRYGSPSGAVLFVGVVGALSVFAGKNSLLPIVNLMALCFSGAYLVTCLSMIKLRRLRPELDRPYRMPGGTWLPKVAAGLAAVLTVMATVNIWLSSIDRLPLEFFALCIWIVLGGALWHFGRQRRCAINETERSRLFHLR